MTMYAPKALSERKNEEFMIGIDEAGRGPVLGSMIYSCAFCPIQDTDNLKQINAQDSKTLDLQQRLKLLDKINQSSFVGHSSISLSARHLSHLMLKNPPISLNTISHNAAIDLIDQVKKQYNLQQVFVDTVGDPQQYQDKLKSMFPEIRDITVSKKADSIYPIVSVASIVAKTTRDEQLLKWSFQENIGVDEPNDFDAKDDQMFDDNDDDDVDAINRCDSFVSAESKSGPITRSSSKMSSTSNKENSNNQSNQTTKQSNGKPKMKSKSKLKPKIRDLESSFYYLTNFGSGYPSDPFCKKWLLNNQHRIFLYPEIVRFSWGTIKDQVKIKENQIISCKFGDEDEQENKDKIEPGLDPNATKMTQFFQTDNTTSKTTKHLEIKLDFRADYLQDKFLKPTQCF